MVRIVSASELISFNGHRCYGIMFGGVNWCYGVSSHRNRGLETAGLQADGRMLFHAVPWTEVGIIQDAADVLRSAKLEHEREN